MHFILFKRQADSAWTVFLEKTLAPLGEIVTVDDKEMMELQDEPGDVLIIDASTETEVEATVTRLRNQRPERRIVVMTASPTWARARAAFEAGAIDYLPKSLSGPELFAAIDEIRRRPLPLWPR